MPLEGLRLLGEGRSLQRKEKVQRGTKEEGTKLEKAEDLPRAHSEAPVKASNPEVLSNLPEYILTFLTE